MGTLKVVGTRSVPLNFLFLLFAGCFFHSRSFLCDSDNKKGTVPTPRLLLGSYQFSGTRGLR